jgi:hypothetical protein
VLGLVLGSGLRCMEMVARLFGGMVVEKDAVKLLPRVAALVLTGTCLGAQRV